MSVAPEVEKLLRHLGDIACHLLFPHYPEILDMSFFFYHVQIDALYASVTTNVFAGTVCIISGCI